MPRRSTKSALEQITAIRADAERAIAARMTAAKEEMAVQRALIDKRIVAYDTQALQLGLSPFHGPGRQIHATTELEGSGKRPAGATVEWVKTKLGNGRTVRELCELAEHEGFNSSKVSMTRHIRRLLAKGIVVRIGESNAGRRGKRASIFRMA